MSLKGKDCLGIGQRAAQGHLFCGIPQRQLVSQAGNQMSYIVALAELITPLTRKSQEILPGFPYF